MDVHMWTSARRSIRLSEYLSAHSESDPKKRAPVVGERRRDAPGEHNPRSRVAVISRGHAGMLPGRRNDIAVISRRRPRRYHATILVISRRYNGLPSTQITPRTSGSASDAILQAPAA